MSDAQKTLTIVRDKFLRMAGVAVTKVTEKLDEQTINARVLAPVCALDIAYGMFQELEPNYFKHNSKKWYNEVRMKFKAIFGTQGILYRSLTDDETMTLNDYMEKITDECKHDTDILWWQLQSHLMDFPQPDREIATKLVFIITICYYTHDMMILDIGTKFVELEHIYRRTSLIVNDMALRLLDHDSTDINFEDKMFEQTLTILFNHINQVTTEGL